MNVVALKGERAPRAERSSMETMIVTKDQIENWLLPPFQRPLRVNEKVRSLSVEIGKTGVISGVITLGTLDGGKTLYVVDGQHRLYSFRLCERTEAILDVRLCAFSNMAQMAEAFVELNSSLVKMRPDDILRGLESSLVALQIIRQKCPFVGYDQIRRGSSSSVIGMSSAIKHWAGSQNETPNVTGGSIVKAAENMDEIEADLLCRFLHIAFTAWGRDPHTSRLWTGLNLCLCMWLYRRLVIDIDPSQKYRRAVRLNAETFKKCLMSLASDHHYHDWLQGRTMNDRDRSPAYLRIKSIFSRRIIDETGKKEKLFAPEWASK